MKFKYRARSKEGELQTGNVEADTKAAALSILSSHDLFILNLEPADQKNWYDFWLGFINRVRSKDMMIFTRQFATILSAKIPLNDALMTLRKQTRNPLLQDVILEISQDIDAGLSLSQALEKHSGIFSVFYVNMIRSAELTGRVEEAMGFLAEYVEKEHALISKVRNAMIYPAIMVAIFIVVGIFMATFILPKIEPIFTEAGVELPFFTRLIIGGANFFLNWWWAVILGLIVLAVIIVDYLRTPEGKNTMDEILLRLPVFGKLLKSIYVARFSESIAILIKGGISIPQAMEVTGYTIGSSIYRDYLHDSAEGIRRGELLSQALAKNQDYFPPLLIQMVAIGETTGRLEDMLERVSGFYTREVNDLVGNLVELIQPALMVVIGLSVGVLFASILIPIFQLAQKI